MLCFRCCPKRPFTLLVLVILGLCVPEEATAQQGKFTATAHVGGTGRYAINRWGLVKGLFVNESDSASTIQLVVMPAGSAGMQFARKVTVPPHVYFESQWPLWIPNSKGNSIDFQYIELPDGEDSGVIRRRLNEQVLPQFTGLVQTNETGYTGWMQNVDAPEGESVATQNLLQAMRYTAHRDKSVITVLPGEVGCYPESLDALGQLAISNQHLEQFPEACQSIRLWVQRGGRLLLFLDQTGPRAAELLLGDVLPMTIVGEASENSVRLQLNSDYRTDSYPVREVLREFDEPVHYLRVAVQAGEPIWFVDGWPVAIRVPYGDGLVLVTTISPDVFAVPRSLKNELEPSHEPIDSMRRFQDTIFNPRSDSLIREEPVTAQAAAQIGYQIPPRSFAVALSLSFPLVLLVGGIALLKRHAGEKLIWLLPAAAILISVPAVGRAWIARGVAPQTVIQTQLLQTLPGQSTLISDGYLTMYNPDPVTLSVKADDSAVMELRQDAANLDYRRLVWTGRDQNEWVNLKQPAGIETFRVRNTRHLAAPVDARATFDKDGLTGQLSVGDLQNFRDAILAGQIPERASVQLDGDGGFRSGSTDLLVAGQFFRTSLINDEQRQHSGILESLFTQGSRLEAFPEQPSLLCWADASESAIHVGDEQTRRHDSLLLVVPVQLEAPAEGSLITIPPTFLPFRVIADESGSFSTLFNNNKRMWDQNGRESAGTIRLQFDVPGVCLPFEADLADVHVKIRAGSRTVRIFGGPLNNLALVHELNSPVGAFDFTIPAESLRESARAGKIYLEFRVSDLAGSPQTISDSGEQDDSWLVESLHLTLRGRRMSIGMN